MRCIVISDCHGNPDYIINALEHSEYNPKEDRLVFAGDFLDIGPSPQECLDILEAAGAEMLWGNHEQAIIYMETINPQSQESWKFADLLRSKVRGPDKWNIATSHDGVLISHAGASQVYAKLLTGYEEMGAQYVAHFFNKRFECIDQEVIADEFWERDSPLWFRPGLMCPLPGIVQVVGHTPASMILPEFRDIYISVDPFARRTDPKNHFRYAIIEDESVTVVDANDFAVL